MKYYFLLILCSLFLCSCIKPIDRHPDARALFEEIRDMSEIPAWPEDVEALEARLAKIKYHGLEDSVKVAKKLIMDMDVYVKTGTYMQDPTSGNEYADRTELSTYKYSVYKSGKAEISGYLTQIIQEQDIDVDRVSSLYNQYHWETEICRMVAKHQVQPGFNKAQVKEALGKPQSVTEDQSGSSVYADWTYKDATMHFVNDELMSFKTNNEMSASDIYTGSK